MSIFHKIQMAILYFGRAARRDASHMVGQAASPTRTMCVDVTLTPSKIKVKIKPGTQTWHSIPSFRFVPDFILSRSQRTITKTGEDHKGPQRSITKECKEPLGTARGRKELQRILNLVVILPHVTLIHLLAAVRKKLCATLNRACMPCYWVSKNGPSVFGGGCSPCKFIRTVKARGMNLS